MGGHGDWAMRHGPFDMVHFSLPEETEMGLFNLWRSLFANGQAGTVLSQCEMEHGKCEHRMTRLPRRPISLSPQSRGNRMTAPVLQMRGVEKRFGGVRALKGVDFEIRAGEVVALAGENGAGKSTLMKILGGVHQPDAGEILIDGEPVAIHSVSDATRYGISFIHQELNVLDNLDVAANVFLGREPLRGGFLRLVDGKRMHEEAAVYLKRLGLDIPTNTLLSRLVHRASTDGRNRQGPFAEGPHSNHGRADIESDAYGNGASARSRVTSCGRRALPSSTFRIA